MIAKVFAVIAVLSLLALLLTMTLIQLDGIDKISQLWIDSSYLLKLRFVFEFRVSLDEITRFGTAINYTIPVGYT